MIVLPAVLGRVRVSVLVTVTVSTCGLAKMGLLCCSCMLALIFVAGGVTGGVGRGRSSHRVIINCFAAYTINYLVCYRELSKTLSHVINSMTLQQQTVLMIQG